MPSAVLQCVCQGYAAVAKDIFHALTARYVEVKIIIVFVHILS